MSKKTVYQAHIKEGSQLLGRGGRGRNILQGIVLPDLCPNLWILSRSACCVIKRGAHMDMNQVNLPAYGPVLSIECPIAIAMKLRIHV